ncbi:MAG TPA: hypothetical protein VGS00_03485 [Thermoanaerobaculia bacterium]|nr:hypothetical protein [Thermoanaerobaculia bacterium]
MVDRDDNDNGYLWDKSGPPDPDVQHLERLLGRLGHRGEAPRPLRRVGRSWVLIAAAAAIVLAAGAAWVARTLDRTHWKVERVAGAPVVADRPIGETARLSVGQVLETDSASRARLAVGLIGEVEVSPNSRLRLVRANSSDHRLTLERGSIGARIWAPPRLFFVQTKSALAVDLGCVYRLSVDDAGSGMLSVETGWVALVEGDREAVVPADASCRMRPGAGPGTPFFDDASPAFRAALDRVDDAPEDGTALETVLAQARRRDALTLWHLLARLPPDACLRVNDRLAELVPAPAGVAREGIARHDRRMLDLWRSELGLPAPETSTLWQRVLTALSPRR